MTQRQIGKIVQNISFTPVFAACSVAYLVAFGLVHWLVGELGVIREIRPATAEGVANCCRGRTWTSSRC